MLKCKYLLVYCLSLIFAANILLQSCDDSQSLEAKKSNSKDVSAQYPKKVADTSGLIIQITPITLNSKKLIVSERSTLNNDNRISYKKPTETLFSLKIGDKLKPDTLHLKNIAPVAIPTSPESAIAKEMASKQENSGSFTYYDKLQGLKQSFVTCMTEDNAGNLWLGTHGGGLTRFDGKTFTYFTDKEGLAGNSIFSIKQTTDEKLWIGTFGKGLSILDGKTFVNISTQNGFPTDLIYVILEDKKGNIWIGTEGGGLIRMDKTDHNYILQYNSKNGFISDKITSLLEDKEGRIWVGSDGKGLAYIDQENHLIIPNQIDISSLTVTDMTSDHQDNIWVSTYGDGLLKLEGNKLLKYQQKNGFPSDLLTSVKTDQAGDIWIATDGKGIVKIENINAQYQELDVFNSSQGLSSDNVYSILQDQSGTMWFGTNRGGVNKLNPSSFTHIQDRTEYHTHHVSSITEDKNKNIWVSTQGNGIIKFLPDSIRKDWNTSVNITTNQGLTNNKVICSLTDTKNRVWFGTEEGVTIIDANDIQVLNKKNGFFGNKVMAIFEDSKGIYWFSLGDRGGIAYYDGDKITCVKDEKNLFKSAVFSIAEDKDGRIWFGTEADGIIIWDGKDFLKFDQSVISNENSVFSILKDAEGLLWIGTEGRGLFVYDGARFYNIDESWGLSNNFVFSILEDKNKDLWIGTRFGLNILSKTNKKRILESLKTNTNDLSQNVYFKNYGYEDGFFGIGCNRNAIYQTSDSSVWIGTSDRLTISHLTKSKKGNKNDTLFNQLHLTNLELFNEKVNWIELYNKKIKNQKLTNSVLIDNIRFSGISSWYNIPENLSLKYNNNYLTFNFSAISQVQPWKIKYQYKMKGLKEDWTAWNYSNTAHYGHLSPNSYILQVRAMDSKGIMSNTVSYPFEIRSPWWSSLWMKMIYFIGLALIIYYIHQSQKNKTIRTERLLSQAKELEQAKEIEKAYTELKATQAQLIQSEKMASLGELTAGIAHEIQNPLNFVNNFSEVSTELLDEMNEELEKGDLAEVKVISNDIKDNLAKINHHGKRADAIVKGMLEHSRSSSGKKEPTDINALCDEYLRLAYHGLRAKDHAFNATMKTDFDTNLEKINIIPQDIGRVVLNLLTNAFYAVNERNKIGEEGYEPTINISTQLIANSKNPKANSQLLIAITDNGLGIPDAIKDKIFQPFFTTKPTGQGTGLGLSLSYDIVKAHGGVLKVETAENQGTTFIIQLPVF